MCQLMALAPVLHGQTIVFHTSARKLPVSFFMHSLCRNLKTIWHLMLKKRGKPVGFILKKDIKKPAVAGFGMGYSGS